MRILFTIFIFSLFIFSSKAQWIELNTGMENPPLFNDVYAITPDIVVVVGNNGTILKSTDGGETWQLKPSGTTAGLGDVKFVTPDIGYVTGNQGKLLKTIDGGETWTIIDFDQNYILISLSCVNEDLIFISGLNSDSNSIILKSNNGGNSWETIIGNLSDAIMYNLHFFNEEIGYSSSYYFPSYEYKILKTENGGITWNQIDNSLIPFHFLDENLGFYYFGGIYKTIDGGSNFERHSEGLWEVFVDIFAINENNIWGILAPLLDGDGSTRGIAKIASSDSEIYLETIALENNPEIDMFSIHFADETTGYIVGIKNGKGTIWKNGTGINDFPTETASTDEVGNNLFKIYPNPASKEINIEFNKPTSQSIEVMLSDMAGKQIYSDMFTNRDKVKINTSEFPKGTYILSVKINNKLYNKKIILN